MCVCVLEGVCDCERERQDLCVRESVRERVCVKKREGESMRGIGEWERDYYTNVGPLNQWKSSAESRGRKKRRGQLE